jgi:hypothetical protein
LTASSFFRYLTRVIVAGASGKDRLDGLWAIRASEGQWSSKSAPTAAADNTYA